MWAAFLSAIAGLLAPLLKIFIQTPSAEAVEGQKLGVETQVAASDATALKTEEAIAQAEANAPASQAATVQSLKDGTF